MVRIPTHRAPTHPGEILLEEFLKPLELTQVDSNCNRPRRRRSSGSAASPWMADERRRELASVRRTDGIENGHNNENNDPLPRANETPSSWEG